MFKLTNGWTGGQYSVFRIVLGSYLLFHFAQLLPWGAEMFSDRGVLPAANLSPLSSLFPNILAWADSPSTVTYLLGCATMASMCFIVGYKDRVAAVVMWYVWACLFGRNPLIANPSIPYVGWLLLAHLLVPRAPYGSVEARNRIDPENGWRMPPELFAAAWIVMALAYTYSGYTKLISPSWADGSAFHYVLINPLARVGLVRDLLLAMPPFLLTALTWGALGMELAYAPLIAFARLRPWVWLMMVSMHLGLLMMVDFADLSLGMLMLHLFTFDPAWIRGTKPGTLDTFFYDGSCGLCHGAVRSLLAEDGDGTRFRFAPLQGDTYAAMLPEFIRVNLPDSVVVVTAEGEILTRSGAVLRAMRRLGGLWRAIAVVLSLVPRFALDWSYDRVAGMRYALFGKQADVCPLMPKGVRGRFAA